MTSPRTLVPLLWLLALTSAAGAAIDPAQLEAARALFQAGGKPLEAQQAFAAIAAADPQLAEAQHVLGVLALRPGDVEKSVAYLEKASALAPTNATYLLVLGEAYGASAQKAGLFSKMGLAKKCLAAWDKAIALEPDNLDARTARLQYYRRAPGIVGGGMSKAYAEAEEIRKRDAERGRLALVDLYLAEKKYAEAFALYDTALAQTPDLPVLQFQIGRLVALSGQQLDRGEAALKKYLEHTPAPKEPPLHYAHWRLGNIYEKKGDAAAARTAYEAALQLRADFKPAQEALRKLPAPAPGAPTPALPPP